MNALVSSPQEPSPSPSARPGGPLLRTLVLCDLADSTALIERLGDQRAATLIRRHDRLARDLVQRHAGQEIDKTDGFLVLFVRPIEGIAFALDYQRELRQLGQSEQLDLRARVGVHVGDVVVWENSAADVAHGAKPVEVEGLVKPVAARLASLALPGQILASGVTANLAQRALGELGEKAHTAQWLNHGRYRFKGVPEPLPVYEIGEPGIAPLAAPPWSGKAHREVPWWRRPATVAIEASLLIGGLAASAWWALRPPPAIAFAERDWVVVGSLKNLTGGAAFDDAVETAFRLGLEQSRYVNVLSDLKVRETIGLMQRDPDKTVVDRAVGSEVAMRDGARALILPTVAEIGGKVRITAEVVDPQSQATVYSESVDGSGANSVLSSIDQVNARLRERLGEALASVSKESQPLDKVATKDLDALRAYTLGQRAYDTGNMDNALSLYEQAIRLDQKFALAHIAIARVHGNAGEHSLMLDQLNAASAAPDRLSPRDSLFVEAWRETLVQPLGDLGKWKSLTRLYPDFYPGSGAYAYYAWNINRYEDAIAAATLSASQGNPHASTSKNLLGILYLATDQYSESLNQFKRAASAVARNDYYALVFAAQRQFDQATALLDKNKGSGRPADDIGTDLVRVSLAVDQGRWEEAARLFSAAKSAAEPLGAQTREHISGIELALQSIAGKSDSVSMERYATAEVSTDTGNAADRSQARFHALFAIWLLARTGNAEAAGRLLAAAKPDKRDALLANLSGVAEAEIARANGRPDHAVSKLKALLDGSELYLAHVALLDACFDAKAMKDALVEAQWLANHRGRAYGEYGARHFLTAFNVAQSNLAVLREAEIQLAVGSKDKARISLDRFAQLWPQATLPAAIAARVKAITDQM